MPCSVLLPKLASAIAGLPHDAIAGVALRLKRALCLTAAHDYAAVLDDTRRVLALDARNVDALRLRGLALEVCAAYRHHMHLLIAITHPPTAHRLWAKMKLLHNTLINALVTIQTTRLVFFLFCFLTQRRLMLVTIQGVSMAFQARETGAQAAEQGEAGRRGGGDRWGGAGGRRGARRL
jgi:hypothetical protein